MAVVCGSLNTPRYSTLPLHYSFPYDCLHAGPTCLRRTVATSTMQKKKWKAFKCIKLVESPRNMRLVKIGIHLFSSQLSVQTGTIFATVTEHSFIAVHCFNNNTCIQPNIHTHTHTHAPHSVPHSTIRCASGVVLPASTLPLFEATCKRCTKSAGPPTAAIWWAPVKTAPSSCGKSERRSAWAICLVMRMKSTQWIGRRMVSEWPRVVKTVSSKFGGNNKKQQV